MEKREFLEEWKSIPEQNEQQFTLYNNQNMNAGEITFLWEFSNVFFADAICTKLQQNNIHTVARRQVDNQQLLYHSVKYTNNLNVLSELKVNSQTTTITVSCCVLPCKYLKGDGLVGSVYGRHIFPTNQRILPRSFRATRPSAFSFTCASESVSNYTFFSSLWNQRTWWLLPTWTRSSNLFWTEEVSTSNSTVNIRRQWLER